MTPATVRADVEALVGARWSDDMIGWHLGAILGGRRVVLRIDGPHLLTVAAIPSDN